MFCVHLENDFGEPLAFFFLHLNHPRSVFRLFKLTEFLRLISPTEGGTLERDARPDRVGDLPPPEEGESREDWLHTVAAGENGRAPSAAFAFVPVGGAVPAARAQLSISRRTAGPACLRSGTNGIRTLLWSI